MSQNWKKARIDEPRESAHTDTVEQDVSFGDDFPTLDFPAMSEPQLPPDPVISDYELQAASLPLHDFDQSIVQEEPFTERLNEPMDIVATDPCFESTQEGNNFLSNEQFPACPVITKEQLTLGHDTHNDSFEISSPPLQEGSFAQSFESHDPGNYEDFDPDLDDLPEAILEDQETELDSLFSSLGIENEDLFDEEYFKSYARTSSCDPPLYSGAPISLHESLVAILTTVIRYKLSGACLKGILDLISLHLPKKDNNFKRSLSFFKTYFLHMQGPKEYRYFCSECYDELEPKTKCKKCEKGKICYLVKISLIHQLQALFNRDGFYEKLDFSSDNHVQGNFSDIKDGDLYQEQVNKKILGGEDQISFQLYGDGVQLFDSSKVSSWLVYLTINELSFNERYKQENVLVPMLWIGPVKPPANLLSNAAHQDLKALSQGVNLTVKNHGEKVVTAIVENHTGDTPARSMMLSIVQHNGKCSCQECEQPGEPRAGCPGVRLFPFKPEEMVPRTKERMIEHGSKGTAKVPYLGVKGPSGLANIMPDFVRGTAIDPMHQLYGGCAKKILQLLISPKKAHQKFSLSKHVQTLNSRLVSIKPPLHVPRVPSSLENIAYWKMNEFKAWLLDYSLPVLNGILPYNYLEHHASLVAASQLLNSDFVTEEHLSTAQRLLTEYVAQFQDFYHLNFMTVNFHLLLHLEKISRDLGAQWNFSCFPHESINGMILRMVHGTRWTELQIPASIHMCLGLPDLIENLKDSEVKDFCRKLMSLNQHPRNIVIKGAAILGKCNPPHEIPEWTQQLLQTRGDQAIKKLSTFTSMRKGKFYYVSSSCNFTSRDSTAVVYTHNLKKEVGLIEVFIRVYNCDCQDLNCCCDSELFAVLKQLENVRNFKTLIKDVYVPNVSEYKLSGEHLQVSVHALEGVCVKMNFDGKLFISKPSNRKEHE